MNPKELDKAADNIAKGMIDGWFKIMLNRIKKLIRRK